MPTPVFDSGTTAYVFWQADTGAITESTDGITAATFTALAGTPALIGYIDIPAAEQATGNGIGHAIGTPEGVYSKFGRMKPNASFTIRIADKAFLAANCQRVAGAALPYIALHVGISGRSGQLVFRKCKCASIKYSCEDGGDEAKEVTAQVTFEAMAVQTDGSTRTVTASQARAFGQPLFFHDARTFTITDSAGATADYRPSLMGFSLQTNFNIERKGERPNFGDNAALSRTPYALREGNINTTGTVSMHTALPQTLINGAVNAQDWGDLVLVLSNLDASNTMTLTASSAVPTRAGQEGGDVAGEVSTTLGFEAYNHVIA